MRGRRYVRRSIVASACVGMLGLLPIGPARAQIMGQGSLLEQTQLPNGSWISFDVTPADHGPIFSETAPVVDPVTGYQNAYIVVPDERLVEYTRFPAGNWSSVDLTAMWSLPLVGSNPVPFVDVADHNQSVSAVGTNGDLLDLTRRSDGSWTTSIIALTPRVAISNPEPFVDPVTGFQNVYATTSPLGHLLEYTRLPNNQWINLDLTTVTQGAP